MITTNINSIQQDRQIDIDETQGQPMTAVMIVVGLVNGMIGGTCLVLPLIGARAGYLTTIAVCVITGFIGYYTAYLVVLHLGTSRNIKECLLIHFNHDYRYVVAYSLFIWLSFISFLLIYFRIICLQIQGLMGYHAHWVAPAMALVLIIAIIIIRVYHLGEETLSYGIISIVGYIGFLIWAQITAPMGPRQVVPYGDPIELTSALMMAFSVHGFLAANILRYPKRENYPQVVGITFVAGTLAYLFIAYGSFAIINRETTRKNPQIINDYFYPGQWQNTLIEIIYMVHMLSAYPNFLLISKLRFFQMLKIDYGNRIDWKEIIYIACVVLASYIVYLLNIHLDVMIDLNGAIIGFAYVIIIPIFIHLACVFNNRSSGFINDQQQWNRGIEINQCQCDNNYRSKWTLYAETIFLIFIILMGIGLMIVTISKIAKGHSIK